MHCALAAASLLSIITSKFSNAREHERSTAQIRCVSHSYRSAVDVLGLINGLSQQMHPQQTKGC